MAQPKNLAFAKQPKYENKDDNGRYQAAAQFVCNTARDQSPE